MEQMERSWHKLKHITNALETSMHEQCESRLETSKVIGHVMFHTATGVSEMSFKALSPERILELKNVEIEMIDCGKEMVANYQTQNHWNNEEWFGSICQVSGTGKYRFNQLGTDGFAWRQYRFNNKDDAIEFLCMGMHRFVQVKEGDGQYEVRTTYMEGY